MKDAKKLPASYTRTQQLKKALIYGVFLVVALCVIAPIIVIFFASVKDMKQMASLSPLLPPPLGEWTVSNYMGVLGSDQLLISFRNSAILVVISVTINILLGSITAFCLDRFEFRFKKLVFTLFMLGMLVPTHITEIVRFKVINGVGAYNTLMAPIIIYAASDLMQLYIFRQFVSKIPVSLDESAMLDGCGYFRMFWSIIFPLLAPASATLAIIKSVDVINDMYIPYLYMPKANLRTLTTFLMDFSGQTTGSWQKLSAAVIVIMIPTLLLYLFFQKYIFAGIVSGASKE